MSEPPVPVLLLDVMGTLVHDPFDEEIPAFFGMSQAELLAVKHPTAWLDFERGRISEAEYFRLAFPDGRTFDGEALKRGVRGAYRWLPGMEELLAELAERALAMHALSNYPVWYRMIEEKLRLSRFLAWSFVSCHTGVLKPEPEAYLGAAAALARAPAECLFIDDRASNCAAAEALGMDAQRFTGARALRRELRARGLL